MGSTGTKRALIVAAFLAIVAAVGLVSLLGRNSRNSSRVVTPWSKSSPLQENPATIVSTPLPPKPGPSQDSQIPEGAAPGNLIIPVAGVRPDQLRDTFSESRSEGRVHDAIDIPATLGTPVLAAAEGTIVKLFQSERGGTTVYQLSTDNKFVYYYAHLDRYAEGLTEGRFAKQGETIAYVGDSGNAGAGNYHLHFSIALINDPKHYWDGVNINPYPLLKR